MNSFKLQSLGGGATWTVKSKYKKGERRGSLIRREWNIGYLEIRSQKKGGALTSEIPKREIVIRSRPLDRGKLMTVDLLREP